MNIISMSCPNQLRINSYLTPTMVGDDRVFIGSWNVVRRSLGEFSI